MKFELVHIGINCENEQGAIATAEKFCALFHWECKIGNSSVFADKYIECMKKPFLGKYGHIAVGTPDIDAAMAYLKDCGFSFNEASMKTNQDGQLTAVYLSDEIGGFAIHLVKIN